MLTMRELPGAAGATLGQEPGARQQSTAGEPRFTLLATIREYATEQLAASGEEAALQQRHAHYFLKLAEEVEPHLSSPEGDIWLERLEREDANLLAALAWSKANQDAVETGLRLAGVLYYYWFLLGSLREGRTWLEEMLARTGALRSVHEATPLGSGLLAPSKATTEAAPFVQRIFCPLREGGDKRLTATARCWESFDYQGNRCGAPRSEESRTLFKDWDVWNEAFTLYAWASSMAQAICGGTCILRKFAVPRARECAVRIVGVERLGVVSPRATRMARSWISSSSHSCSRPGIGDAVLFLINMGDLPSLGRSNRQALGRA
jgi:hypothetical protein